MTERPRKVEPWWAWPAIALWAVGFTLSLSTLDEPRRPRQATVGGGSQGAAETVCAPVGAKSRDGRSITSSLCFSGDITGGYFYPVLFDGAYGGGGSVTVLSFHGSGGGSAGIAGTSANGNGGWN